MPIDIEREKVFSLTQATKVLPRVDGKKVHVSTVWRWCRRGLNGVKLEHVRLGHRVCTSTPAISRFVNALAAVENLTPVACRSQQVAVQQGSEASIKRSEAVLDRAGI